MSVPRSKEQQVDNTSGQYSKPPVNLQYSSIPLSYGLCGLFISPVASFLQSATDISPSLFLAVSMLGFERSVVVQSFGSTSYHSNGEWH